MLNVALPAELETAVLSAARRSGQSVDDYVASVCADALSLEVDRSRLDSFLCGTPAIPHDLVRGWLDDLVAGERTECPR